MIEMCGEVEDEDTSLAERAEERADRFEDYSDKRKGEANQAHDTVQTICDGIPLGQPILVGHHSEKHARKDAERIQNGMRKAVNLWEQSKYWAARAKGAIRVAKYKERPDVRARRMKPSVMGGTMDTVMGAPSSQPNWNPGTTEATPDKPRIYAGELLIRP